MPNRRSCCLSIALLTLLLAVILATVAVAAFWLLPEQTEAAFGPPSPGLQQAQRALLSLRLLLQKQELTRPLDPTGEEQEFQIELGESTGQIASRLEQEGLIASQEAFLTYLQYSGLDTGLQAGEYRLSSRLTAIEVAQKLQDATPTEVRFNILPGWRAEEIAQALPTSGLTIPAEAFEQALNSRPESFPFLSELPEQATLEGFLFPDRYRVPRSATAEELVALMLSSFQAKVNSDLRDGFQRNGLSLFEAVTLASIVQREAVVESEMPLIASVFYNRLELGLKLDSDPTVQYALGYNPDQKSWWTNPLSLADLKIDSPYNTYQNTGLPPGPIANPGLNALQAVAYPAQSPYYYFRAACDGSGKHVFSETFEEHLGKECP